MADVLVIRNSQRRRRIDTVLLKRVAIHCLTEILFVQSFEIGIHLIRVNRDYLQPEGSTDVITFDHGDASSIGTVFGEIYISVDDAVAQAEEFDTTWQSELVRYAVHGMLHLLGHDDTNPAARTRMKREENRCLRILKQQFNLNAIARK